MRDQQPCKILPFVPLDRDRLNRDLDQEIIDRERAKELEKIAEAKLFDLYIERIANGDIEHGPW